MSIPHDYYHGNRPDLRSRGNSRPYIEPDYIASEADDQLPLLSTVGRGPRGAGLSIGNLVNEDGEFSFGIYSDLTGEQVMQTPNLSAGRIYVSAKPEEPVAGETVVMDIQVKQGGASSHYQVPIPAGSTGSRIFIASTELEDGGKGHAYQVQVSDLMVYGMKNQGWSNWPTPRVNDVVVFKASGKIGFGTIETVQDGMVVFTSQVLFDPLAHVSIGEDGNWEIDGTDTGVAAQGPRGEQGPAGPKGDKGDKGDPDGLPARMTVGSVTEGDKPAFTVHLADETTNTYSINVTLPKGDDGRSINVNGGIYKLPDLPSFDDTPVNDAFIVNDYEESEDHRYDLYIRGKEPVIAEEGGPWTVVEDWQGVQGFSTRVLTGYSIDPDEAIRITKEDAETAFTPHIGILDGDLCTDGRYLGIIGSAMDDSGDYTVTFVAKVQIGWDDVVEKPTDLVHQPALDAETQARQQGDQTNADAIAAETAARQQGDASLQESVEAEATARQQQDQALQAAIDALPTTGDLTGAIAAEAAERQKQDDLLQNGIDSKMQISDLVAGDNVTIDTESQPGRAVISSKGGASAGDYVPYIAETGNCIVAVTNNGPISSNDDESPYDTLISMNAQSDSALFSVANTQETMAMLTVSNSGSDDELAKLYLLGKSARVILAGSEANDLSIGGIAFAYDAATSTARFCNTKFNVQNGLATQDLAGFMSAEDKTKLDSLTKPSVDIVKTMEHSTSYTGDTLEIVVDTTGKVTSMYFIDATTKHEGGSPGNQ